MEVRKIVENNPHLDELTLSEKNEYHQTEQNIAQNLFEDALSFELEQFDTSHRTVFYLRYQQNFSIKEIGNIMDCSEGTVKSRLFYTTQKLAHKLKAFNPFKVEVT